MGPILVRVRKDDDLIVFQAGKVEILPNVGADGGDDGAEFLVGQHLVQPLLFHVQGLAPKGQNRLEPPVPPEEETVPEPEEGKETPAAEEKEDKEKPAEEKSAENAAPAGEKPAAEKSVNSAPAGEKSAAVKEEKPAGTAPAKEEVR